MNNKVPSVEIIQKVASECEGLSINMISSYRIIRTLIEEFEPQSEGVCYADILSQFLRSAARDLEDIVEALTGEKTGFYQNEFGSVLEQNKGINHAQ